MNLVFSLPTHTLSRKLTTLLLGERDNGGKGIGEIRKEIPFHACQIVVYAKEIIYKNEIPT